NEGDAGDNRENQSLHGFLAPFLPTRAASLLGNALEPVEQPLLEQRLCRRASSTICRDFALARALHARALGTRSAIGARSDGPALCSRPFLQIPNKGAAP